MNAEQMIAYTDTLLLEYALWWYIENTNEDTVGRTDLFFHLRQRMRNEAPIKPNPTRGRPRKQSCV
jgi:hypothetical protein